MHLNKTVLVSALVSALLLTVPVAAEEGDPQQGKAKAGLCASCHGLDGIAKMDVYPNLAGQNEAYLVIALKAYKDKQRQGGQAAIMQGMAANLSEQDILDLAAYYSSLEP